MEPSRSAASAAHGVALGRNIKAELIRQSISREDAAAALGINVYNLQRRLSGTVRVSVNELQIIAGLCGVAVADLLPPVDVAA